jgi:very-short-patch-repair endonuclease
MEFLREHAKKVLVETGKWKESAITIAKMRRNFRSKAEERMNRILASLGVVYLWNAPLDTPIGTKFPDFQILVPKKIIVEVDGPLHEKKEWEERDAKKDQAYMQMGFSVLRFSTEEVEKETEKVKQLILRALAESGVVYRSWKSKSWELEKPTT